MGIESTKLVADLVVTNTVQSFAALNLLAGSLRSSVYMVLMAMDVAVEVEVVCLFVIYAAVPSVLFQDLKVIVPDLI